MTTAARPRAKRCANSSAEEMKEVRFEKRVRQAVNKKLRVELRAHLIGMRTLLQKQYQATSVEELLRVPPSPTDEELDARVPLTPTFLNCEFAWNGDWWKSS